MEGQTERNKNLETEMGIKQLYGYFKRQTDKVSHEDIFDIATEGKP